MNEPSHHTNFRKRQEEELGAAQQQQNTTPLEFETPEELLRHDASTIEVPAGVVDRLAESAHQEPPAPWWKRLLNG
ncbi:MAG TPA: hypothetical protein DCY13_06355 [Verrucomicrobiales bacterium]|nr:hypothetical protein [Verrucomicrobiales bacterium]